MSNDLVEKLEKLDGKQAIYVAQRLSEIIFKQVPPPSLTVMAGSVEQASPAGSTSIAQRGDLSKATLGGVQAGDVARAILKAWAATPELAPAVEEALERFKTPKQDLGILSVPVALGLTYALLSMDLNVDLGSVKIKKKGLSSQQQTQIIKSTLAPVLKAIRALGNG
jgi:hypothetical protein